MIDAGAGDLKKLYEWGWRDGDRDDDDALAWIGDRGLGPLLVALRAGIARHTPWPVTLTLFDATGEVTPPLEIMIDVGRETAMFLDEDAWRRARQDFFGSFHRWQDRPAGHPLYDAGAEEAVRAGQALVDRAGASAMILVGVSY